MPLSPVGDLIRRAWQIYRERAKVFLGILVLPFALSLILSLIAALPKNAILITAASFLYIPSVIISWWSYVALLHAIKEREIKIGIKDSLGKGWNKILSFIWISFLLSFIILGGLFLFVIPGIILSVWFGFSIYVLVSEDLRGMNALLRSKQLVNGYWWKVFWRFIAVQLMILIIILPVSVFIALSKYPALNNFYQLIVSIFFMPFVAAYSYLIYEDLINLKRDVPFVPKRGTKGKFILVGIVGLLLLGLFLALSLPYWKPLPPA